MHPLDNELSNGLGYLTFEQPGYNFYTSSETQNCNSNPIHVSRNNKIWIEYRISTYQTTLFALSVIKLSQCVPIDCVCCCFPPPPRGQKPLPFSKCFPPGQPLLLSFSSYRCLWFETRFVTYYYKAASRHVSSPEGRHILHVVSIISSCTLHVLSLWVGKGRGWGHRVRSGGHGSNQFQPDLRSVQG